MNKRSFEANDFFFFFKFIITVTAELQIHDNEVIKIIIAMSINSTLITYTCNSCANSSWSEAKKILHVALT